MISFLENPLVEGNPYHYPSFIEKSVKFDNSIKAWKVILIIKTGEIVAIIPIFSSQKKFPIKFALFNLFNFNINLLKLFGSNISYRKDLGLSAFLDIINEQLKSFMPFDLGVLDAIAADSPLLSEFKGNKKGGITIRPIAKNYDVVRYLEFPESWDHYLSTMKRKRRYNLRRNIKILSENCNNEVKLNIFLPVKGDIQWIIGLRLICPRPSSK